SLDNELFTIINKNIIISENKVNKDAKQNINPSFAKFNSLLILLLLKIKYKKKKLNLDKKARTI
ncbi:MAG: hypothetical protein K2L08_04160, partial [Erysipelotrichaceae bacterium]|nr:hypothetical protein [Erysipelotrichaceae bacterium]